MSFATSDDKVNLCTSLFFPRASDFFEVILPDGNSASGTNLADGRTDGQGENQIQP